jgi:hypothetical protein
MLVQDVQVDPFVKNSGSRCFYLPPLPATLGSLTPVSSMYSSHSTQGRGSARGYEWYHEYFGNPGSHLDRHPFDQYPNDPTDQTAPPDPTVTPLTQYAHVWAPGDGLYQAPGTVSTISPIDPTPPHASEGGYSIVGAQPTGIYLAPPQVSSAAAPTMEVLA